MIEFHLGYWRSSKKHYKQRGGKHKQLLKFYSKTNNLHSYEYTAQGKREPWMDGIFKFNMFFALRFHK